MKITNPPRDLSYSKRHAEVYEKLKNDELSPFYGSTYKDIFLFAMAYGFRHNLSDPLEYPQANIPLSVFSDEEKWLIRAVAIEKTGKLETLSDEKRVYEVAEKYANGALDTIHAEILGGKPGEPYKRMVQDVLEEYQKVS